MRITTLRPHPRIKRGEGGTAIVIAREWFVGNTSLGKLDKFTNYTEVNAHNINYITSLATLRRPIVANRAVIAHFLEEDKINQYIHSDTPIVNSKSRDNVIHILLPNNATMKFTHTHVTQIYQSFPSVQHKHTYLMTSRLGPPLHRTTTWPWVHRTLHNRNTLHFLQ